MKIYFVRHGESELNAVGIHQFSHTPLSKTGEIQAKMIAKRFESIKIDKTLSSDYRRAQQTAEIICKHNNFLLEIEENLREKRWPTEFMGRQRNSSELITIKKLIQKNAHNPMWHYTDEENLYDVEIRAENCLKIFRDEVKNGVENLLIVSHGTFIRTLILKMMLGTNIENNIYYSFREFMVMNNTGITIVSLENEIWKLLTWNDYAHLGE